MAENFIPEGVVLHGKTTSGTIAPILVDSDGKITVNNIGNVDNVSMKENTLSLPVINGGGFAITTGVKKAMYRVPFNCTITGAGAIAGQSTTTTIDIWRTTYANYDGGGTHPVDGDSITASAPISISASTKALDTTLTGWTKTLAEGDILWLNVDANNNAQILGVFLEVTRT